MKKEISLGQFRLTLHAQLRMTERGVRTRDLIFCARWGQAQSSDEKIKIIGHDLDGEPLCIICAWDGETIVITVF